MTDYRKVFSQHGYSLFEPENLERAIIEAIQEGNLRYLYGIPILLEKEDVDLQELERLARSAKVWRELHEIFLISSKIISDKDKADKLEKMAGKPERLSYGLEGFRSAYHDYGISREHEGFSPELSYHLSFIFAKKQISILYKIKARKKLTKTEKEYFSRVIKKKLMAIKETSGLAKELLS